MTMRSIPVAVAVATALIGLLIGLLMRRAKGTADGRVELAVVPTSGFDPSIEEIIRYAAHLVRTRRLRDMVSGRRGRTVRLSLRSVGEGQLVQTIDVAESAAAMVRRHPLDGVEMITLAELDRRIAGVVGADSSQPAGASESSPEPSAGAADGQRREVDPSRADAAVETPAPAATAAASGGRHLRRVAVAVATVQDEADPDVDPPVVWPSIHGDERHPDG